MKRNALKILLSVAILSCAIFFPFFWNGAKQPNIIWIVIDTARADHFSSYGYELDTTPNIDKFVGDSVLFQNAHSVAPWTLPSHMSMFTGLMPGQHGATWSLLQESDDPRVLAFQFAEPERLLTNRLKQAGYRTLGFSGNPWICHRLGFDDGFDFFLEPWRAPVRKKFARSYSMLSDEAKIRLDYDTSAIGVSIAQFKHMLIQSESEQPFFAFFNIITLHYPYLPPREFRSRFSGDPSTHIGMSRMNLDSNFNEWSLMLGYSSTDISKLIPFYDAELNYVDFMLGDLFGWLKEQGLYDDAVIIVTSDHGEHLGEEGRFSHQLSIEEELLRIPLIIKYPGFAHAKLVVEDPLVSNIDIYSTLLSFAGENESDSRFPVASVSLADPADFERDQLMAEYYVPTVPLDRFVKQYDDFDDAPHRLVRRAIYKDGLKFSLSGLNVDSIADTTGSASHHPEGVNSEPVTEWVRGYVGKLAGGAMEDQNAGDVAEDQGFAEELRALGYLE